MQPTISFASARKFGGFLLIVVCGLVLLSVAGQLAKYWYGHGHLHGFVPAFYVDYESNVPTWYSSFALGVAAAILAAIACLQRSAGDRFWRHWGGLAALFLLLSLDEVAMLHELPIETLRDAWSATGLLYYTWVVPGAAFVAVVGIACIPFLKHLPRKTAALFLLAGALFVGGAIGVEMLSGLQADSFGEETLGYALIITCEEALEMLGVVLFIYALLDYANASFGTIYLGFKRSRNSA